MITRTEAQALDRADPLGGFRDRFVITEGGPIYLDGNSLGRLPRATAATLRRLVEDDWGGRLVEAWEEWIDLPQRVGARLAPLIGAAPDEVIVADSTSANLHRLAGAVLDAFPTRRTLVTDAANFPTDRYVLAGLAAERGGDLRLIGGDPVAGPKVADVAAALDDGVALVCLSHAAYRSAALADLAAITAAAHAHGALMLWDLSHSVGVVPIDLAAAGADLAVGCTYKYLNGGPGSPAFLYVRRDLQERLRNPLWGWFGHADQFAFEAGFRPAPGLTRFLVGSIPVLGLTAAGAGIDLVGEAGLPAVRAKSLTATAMMLGLYDERLAPLGVGLGTPRQAERRGSHLALLHPEGLALSRWLRAEGGVVADFRPPDVLRFAVSPLYTTYTEVWDALDALASALESGAYRGFAPGGRVT
ncbi:MAG: kynureninase [Acidimicrobiia bacterium]|nr:kynureninase [Acidimicrobiia bacterium]